MFVTELTSAVTQLLLFALIPFVWWLVTAVKKENFFKWIGLKKIARSGSLLAGLWVVAAILVYGLSVTWFVNNYADSVTTAGSDYAGMGLAGLPYVLVYGIIKTALSEELLFRGFLLKRIANKFGFAAGNTVQALLFGLLHGLPFGLASGSVLAGVVLTLAPAAMGWVEGWFNEKKCGGSIIPSWFFHAAVNVTVACMSL